MDIEWAKDGVEQSALYCSGVLKQFMGKIKKQVREIYKPKENILITQESH
jgi:hypothetical protein